VGHVVTVKLRTHDQQMLANSVGKIKVCRVFKNLAILCWPTMLAVYELVRFFVGQQAANRACDWLAVVNIMAAKWTDASCVEYTNYTLPFHLSIIYDCTQTILGAYVFTYEQLNKSLLQQRRRRLLSLPSPPYGCPTKQILTNNCWPTFVGRVSAA